MLNKPRSLFDFDKAVNVYKVFMLKIIVDYKQPIACHVVIPEDFYRFFWFISTLEFLL